MEKKKKVRNRESSKKIPHRYIVNFFEGVSAKEQNRIIKQFGGKVLKKYRTRDLDRFAVVEIDDSKIDDLLDHETVESIDQDVQAPAPSATELEGWGIHVASVKNFWDAGFTGRGVKIALIDTGMTQHPDLPIPLSTWNVVTDSAAAQDVNPSSKGHGTLSASVIASRGNNSGIKGVAFNADIHVINAYYQKEGDTTSSYTNLSYTTEALEYAATLNIDVVLCNVQLDSGSSSLQKACNALEAKGIPILAAAGNFADENGDVTKDTVKYPGHYDTVVAVGAVELSTSGVLDRANYSGTGPYLDITSYTGQVALGKDGNLGTYSGTSCATPFATGVMALLKQAYPNLTAQQLRDKLYSGVHIVNNQNEFGRGMINLPQSLLPTQPSYPVISSVTTEGFEDTNFNFSITGDWVIGTDGGNTVLKSPETGDYANTTATVKFQVSSSAVNPELRITHRTDTASNDRFTIYVNGIPLVRYGGITSYTTSTLALTPGTKYRVDMNYEKSSSGTSGLDTVFVDSFEVIMGTTPSGQGTSFDNPIVVSGTSASGTIPSGGDLFFKYVPSATGTHTLTLATSFDSYLELYAADKATLIMEDDDGNGNGQPKISYSLSAGTTYYLKAYGYNHNASYFGACTLNIAPPAAGTSITETFESSSMTIPFTGDWTRTTTTPQAGSYCYRSGAITHNQTSQTSFKVTAPSGGQLSFYYRTDSENNYDKLTVTAGSTTLVNGVSGTGGAWTSASYTLPAGTTEITFKYTKDGSTNSGTDAVYIDQVVVSGTGITVSPGSGSTPSTPGTASVMITGITSSSLTLTMSSTNATSFNVYRSTSLNGTYSLVGSRVSGTWTDSGLQPNTMYYYTAEGVNGTLVGPRSNVTQARTDTSSGGGVTPVTKLEDFNDSSYNFTFTTNEWDMGSGDANVGITTGMNKKFIFAENVPSGAVNKSLSYKYKIQPLSSTYSCQINVRINGTLKATHTQNDNTYRTNTIVLGTGLQTIEFEATGANGTVMARIDDLSVSWS